MFSAICRRPSWAKSKADHGIGVRIHMGGNNDAQLLPSQNPHERIGSLCVVISDQHTVPDKQHINNARENGLTSAGLPLNPVIIIAEFPLAPAAEGMVVEVAPSTTLATTTRPIWKETWPIWYTNAKLQGERAGRVKQSLYCIWLDLGRR